MAIRKKLGEILVEQGAIEQEMVKRALGHQRQWGGKLGRILVEMKALTEEQLARGLAAQSRMPLAKMKGEIAAELLSLIPFELAEKRQAVVFGVRTVDRVETVYVAIADPYDLPGMDEIRFQIGKPVKFALAPADEILDAVKRNLAPSHGLALDDEDCVAALVPGEPLGAVVAAPRPAEATLDDLFAPPRKPASPASDLDELLGLSPPPAPRASSVLDDLFNPPVAPPAAAGAIKVTRFPPKRTPAVTPKSASWADGIGGLGLSPTAPAAPEVLGALDRSSPAELLSALALSAPGAQAALDLPEAEPLQLEAGAESVAALSARFVGQDGLEINSADAVFELSERDVLPGLELSPEEMGRPAPTLDLGAIAGGAEPPALLVGTDEIAANLADAVPPLALEPGELEAEIPALELSADEIEVEAVEMAEVLPVPFDPSPDPMAPDAPAISIAENLVAATGPLGLFEMARATGTELAPEVEPRSEYWPVASPFAAESPGLFELSLAGGSDLAPARLGIEELAPASEVPAEAMASPELGAITDTDLGRVTRSDESEPEPPPPASSGTDAANEETPVELSPEEIAESVQELDPFEACDAPAADSVPDLGLEATLPDLALSAADEIVASLDFDVGELGLELGAATPGAERFEVNGPSVVPAESGVPGASLDLAHAAWAQDPAARLDSLGDALPNKPSEAPMPGDDPNASSTPAPAEAAGAQVPGDAPVFAETWPERASPRGGEIAGDLEVESSVAVADAAQPAATTAELATVELDWEQLGFEPSLPAGAVPAVEALEPLAPQSADTSVAPQGDLDGDVVIIDFGKLGTLEDGAETSSSPTDELALAIGPDSGSPFVPEVGAADAWGTAATPALGVGESVPARAPDGAPAPEIESGGPEEVSDLSTASASGEGEHAFGDGADAPQGFESIAEDGIEAAEGSQAAVEIDQADGALATADVADPAASEPTSDELLGDAWHELSMAAPSEEEGGDAFAPADAVAERDPIASTADVLDFGPNEPCPVDAPRALADESSIGEPPTGGEVDAPSPAAELDAAELAWDAAPAELRAPEPEPETSTAGELTDAETPTDSALDLESPQAGACEDFDGQTPPASPWAQSQPIEPGPASPGADGALFDDDFDIELPLADPLSASFDTTEGGGESAMPEGTRQYGDAPAADGAPEADSRADQGVTLDAGLAPEAMETPRAWDDVAAAAAADPGDDLWGAEDAAPARSPWQEGAPAEGQSGAFGWGHSVPEQSPAALDSPASAESAAEPGSAAAGFQETYEGEHAGHSWDEPAAPEVWASAPPAEPSPEALWLLATLEALAEGRELTDGMLPVTVERLGPALVKQLVRQEAITTDDVIEMLAIPPERLSARIVKLLMGAGMLAADDVVGLVGVSADRLNAVVLRLLIDRGAMSADQVLGALR